MKKNKQNEIVESLAAAAARLKVDLHVVKKAKRAGCTAFRPGNRVHCGELKQYLEANPPPGAPALPPLTDEQVAAQAGIEDSLAGAVRDELEIGRELQNARARGDTAAVADLVLAISRARKARLAIEAAVTKLQVERGQLISADAHKLSAFRMWHPMVNYVRRIPRKAAVALADLDAVRIERCVDQEVEAAIAECKKMLVWPDEEQKKLARKLLLFAVTGEDRRFTPETLEQLDALRSVVVAELAEQAGASASSPTEKAQITSEF